MEASDCRKKVLLPVAGPKYRIAKSSPPAGPGVGPRPPELEAGEPVVMAALVVVVPPEVTEVNIPVVRVPAVAAEVVRASEAARVAARREAERVAAAFMLEP